MVKWPGGEPGLPPSSGETIWRDLTAAGKRAEPLRRVIGDFHHPNCQYRRRRRTLPPLPALDIVAANRPGQVKGSPRTGRIVKGGKHAERARVGRRGIVFAG